MLGVVLLSMDLFVFLQILGTFEGLLANLTNMRLEWRMNCQQSTAQPRCIIRRNPKRSCYLGGGW